jgi:LDH2 family malate/lactate/ureidoglycolate dehydrogenase
VRVVSETDGVLVLDGDHGGGPAAPERAMRWCIEHARGRGMTVAVIRDWQMIVGAPWVRMAAEAGMIGFACTNFIPLVAPPGGRTPVLGTNPFAYGLPSDPPVVLDVATSVVAMQKVRAAAADGESLPEGLIFDADGRPTTDPTMFESLAPLGSPFAPHKGFGLALFIEALTGVLSGGDPGVFLWALDVTPDFRARMDALVERVRASGDDVVLPGERGERRLRELAARGEVPLSAGSWELLKSG